MMDVEGEDIQAEGDCSKKSGVAGVCDWSNEGPEQEERVGTKGLLRTALRPLKALLLSQGEKCLNSPIFRFLFYSSLVFII